MKKFLSISILTLLVLTVLSGCQLAKKFETAPTLEEENEAFI